MKQKHTILLLFRPKEQSSGTFDSWEWAPARPTWGIGRTASSARTIRVGLALLLLSVVLAPCALAQNRDRVLTVITRNMDNGTDFGPIFAAQTQAQLVAADSATFAEIQASNIPERAAGIAAEIAAAQPDVVGLQEVFTYRVGPFGATPTTVVYDALQSLLTDLSQRGLQYAPAAILTNIDAVLPAFNPVSGLFNVRATDHDVVLVRTDLPVSQFKLLNVQAQHFTTNLVFNNPLLGSVEIPRGWISVDVKKRGKSFRFITTHLESFSRAIQVAQANELAQGPANTDTPVLFAGDFNCDAQSADPTVNAAHRILLGAGFTDTWSVAHPTDAGFTFPLHGEDPYTPFATPIERIDWVLERGAISLTTVDLIGNTSADLTPSGLWPSDHAGLVASFVLEP